MTQIKKINPTLLSIFLLKSVSDPFFLFGGEKGAKKGYPLYIVTDFRTFDNKVPR